MRATSMLAAAALCVAFASGCRSPVLSTDFNAEPRRAGWACRPAAPRGPKPECHWKGGNGARIDAFVEAAPGRWVSPAFEVEPFQYYELRFVSMASHRASWSAFFHDGDGREMSADNYSGIYPSDTWVRNRFCFQAEKEARTARISFGTVRGGKVGVDKVRVLPISRGEVVEWADEVYAALPPLEYRPPKERGGRIERSLRKLREGEDLTVVMLGDSIVNDLANSPLDALLEEAYPGSRVRVISSVRGGTSCAYYRREGRVAKYVLRHKPDLLIIGGVSHHCNTGPIRDVIRQVRAESDADILVLSGAIAPWEGMAEGMAYLSPQRKKDALQKVKAFPERLGEMAQEELVEYLDLRTAWERYVGDSGRSREWFMRDIVHANARGKQIMARIVLRYLAPDAGSPEG